MFRSAARSSAARLSSLCARSAVPRARCGPRSAQEWATKMFSVTSHNFGTVAKGSKTEYRFVFRNIYKEDLHVVGVRTSCGCTSPEVTKRDLKTHETARGGREVQHADVPRPARGHAHGHLRQALPRGSAAPGGGQHPRRRDLRAAVRRSRQRRSRGKGAERQRARDPRRQHALGHQRRAQRQPQLRGQPLEADARPPRSRPTT